MVRKISEKFDVIVTLATHWRTTMPQKPRRKGSAEWRDWDGLTILLDEFIKFVPVYQNLLGKVPPVANPGFVRNQGPDRLLESFSIISRACEQRRGAVNGDSMSTHLAQSEDVLEDYCARWKPQTIEKVKYEKLETPVVYFDKLYGITRALFKPQIPVISIPLTDYNQRANWLALAHEFGHHIYWNSLTSIRDVDEFHGNLVSAIRRTISAMYAEVWENWLEEIFADVCGVLFAGPDYVVSCQELAAEQVKSLEDFVLDDHEHPSLFIRPVIVEKVMEETKSRVNNGTFESAHTTLAQRWNIFSEDLIPQLDSKLRRDNNDIPDDKLWRERVEVLKNEVSAVVSTVLYEPCWPGGLSLLNLVDFYGKNPLSAQEILELEEIKNIGVIPPVTFAPRTAEGIIDPSDEDVPENLKDLWEFIKARLANRTSGAPEPLKKWTALLELGLEEDHSHFFKHYSLKRHVPWGRWHRHTEGNATIWS
jgi:hypothetical protein